ncbi:glycosyltransferase [Undibacterium sp. Di24W]|uniref:glycosyltransferase n=1 Tax=Undibacterium sp. Di24W TaxID=3413033 RepID=UPI003BF19CCA
MIETPQDDVRLLEDALARTLKNPTASFGWHRMVTLLRRLADARLSLQVERAILARVDEHGYAGFLRASFLDVLTGRPEYLAQGGRVLLSLPEFDPDRAVIFFQSSWQRVLLDIPDRASFYARLSAISLPEIAARLNQHVQQLPAPKLPSRPISTIRKVALIAPLLTNLKHPPTLMALQQARCLRQCGYQVVLYAAQEMLGPDSEHYLGSGIVHQTPQFVTQGWEHYLGLGGQVMTGDVRFSISQRWLSLVTHMAQFDPDLVMTVGLYSGLLAMLYSQRPVLGLGVNSLAPISPSDLWLTAQKDLHDSTFSAWGTAGHNGVAFYHPYRLDRPVTLLPVNVTSLEWNVDHVVLTTLVSEAEARISGAWANGMCQVLARFPQIRWLIVGGNGQLPSALAGVAAQVRCVPFCADALKYLSCTHVYVNPPMMGGGFAVAEAMAAAVPAVSMRDTDGGDKLGAAAVSDLPSYFELLQRLIQDAGYRQTMGLQLQTHFNQALDLAQAAPSLQQACELAVTRYRLRT